MWNMKGLGCIGWMCIILGVAAVVTSCGSDRSMNEDWLYTTVK